MSIAITLDPSGRIVLPMELRRRLNLVPGSRLRLDVVAQRIELTPEPQLDSELGQSPSGRAVLLPGGQTLDAAAAVRAERDAQAGGSPRQ